MFAEDTNLFCEEENIKTLFDTVNIELNIPSSETNPAGSYMSKVNNRNTRTRCEICTKLTIKAPE